MTVLRDYVTDFFIYLCKELDYEGNINEIRLKIFKYWYSENEDLSLDLSQFENIEMPEEAQAELCLVKLVNNINKNLNFKDINTKQLKECENYFIKKKDFVSLVKYHLLVGELRKDVNEFSLCNLVFDDSQDKDNNLLYLKTLNKIFTKKYKMEDNNQIEIEDEIKKSLKNTKIEEYLNDLGSNMNNSKVDLLFFLSTPLFKNKNDNLVKVEQPLHTELNNLYYLKYKLESEIKYKNFKYLFLNADDKFKDEIKKYLNNQITLLFIGSDDYDENGDFFYENKNNISSIIYYDELKRIMIKSKNKPDILILGFLNSWRLAKVLISKGYKYIISINQINELTNIFRKYPYYYFYFQRCFFNFVKDFCLDLFDREETISDSFEQANEKFMEGIETEFIEDYNDYNESKFEPDLIKKIFDQKILKLYIQNDFDLTNIDFSINNLKLSKKIDENINDEKPESLDFFQFHGSNYLKINNNLFKQILENRFYGLKKEFMEIIDLVKLNKYVNIYGGHLCGKTKLSFEICKYFYMNNYFADGIFYIDSPRFWEIEKIKKIKEENVNLKILLVFENKNKNLTESYLNLARINANCIILSENDQTHNWASSVLSSNEFDNSNGKMELKAYCIDKPINESFAREYWDYLKISRMHSREDLELSEKDIYLKNINIKISEEF